MAYRGVTESRWGLNPDFFYLVDLDFPDEWHDVVRMRELSASVVLSRVPHMLDRSLKLFLTRLCVPLGVHWPGKRDCWCRWIVRSRAFLAGWAGKHRPYIIRVSLLSCALTRGAFHRYQSRCPHPRSASGVVLTIVRSG